MDATLGGGEVSARLLAAYRAHRARIAAERMILAAAAEAAELERIDKWQFVSHCRDVMAMDVAEVAREELTPAPERPMFGYIPSTLPLPQMWTRTRYDETFLGRHEVVVP